MKDIDWYNIYISPLQYEDNKETKMQKIQNDINTIIDVNNTPSFICWLHLWKQLFFHIFNKI